MPGRGLPIKLHGRLTQGCLGCKETHPSVSGCLLCKYLSHIFPLSTCCQWLACTRGLATARCLQARGETPGSALGCLAHCLCWDDLLHLLILVTCPHVPLSPYPRTSASHATDRLLTPGLRGSLKIAGRVGTRTWLGFERNYKEIILRGFFLQ